MTELEKVVHSSISVPNEQWLTRWPSERFVSQEQFCSQLATFGVLMTIISHAPDSFKK